MRSENNSGKFRYKKNLGQNFLHDTVKISRMIEKMTASENDTFIEIGPGAGSLTRELLPKVKKVIAVEIDPQAIEKLKEKTKDFSSLEIVNCDFLEFDFTQYVKEGEKIKIAGNIPYYITAPIIEKVIENRRFVSKFWLTVQKEVAERITAGPGSKIFGSLSVFCQFYTAAKYHFTIGRKAFFPVPDVDSAFIELDFDSVKDHGVKDEVTFFRLSRAGFGQRRKMLSNNIKREFDFTTEETQKILKEAGVDEKTRAEDIGLDKFAAISNIITLIKERE